VVGGRVAKEILSRFVADAPVCAWYCWNCGGEEKGFLPVMRTMVCSVVMTVSLAR
jgi:hypothetical protein